MAFAINYIGLLSSVVGAILVQICLHRWRRYRTARKYGCEPIVELSARRLGSEYTTKQDQAVKDGYINAAAARDFERCGSSTFVRKTLDERHIETIEPLNHQALAMKMDDWHKEPRPAIRAFSRDNVVLQNGLAWRRSRNLINPLFSRAELSDTEHFRLFVDRMMELVPRDGSSIDMQPLIRKLYLDSTSESIFGQSIDSLRDSSAKSDQFIEAYDRATIGAGKRARPTGFLKHLQFAMSPDKAWLADCKTVHNFVDECIARHRASTHKLSETRKRYLLIDGMSKAIPDPIELRFQLLGVFSVARETPAVVASNALFLLARNPLIWTELREQALSLGDMDTVGFDQLKNLSLFRYTVLETMRLHSPITRMRRMAARDTVLPRGGGPDGSSPAFVSKGTMVTVYMYPNSRDPKIWGEDVEAFRPSRFEERSLGWEFSPFSNGPRICPAHRQVVSQVMYLLYRLTLEFESIENRDPCLRYVEGVMMCFFGKNGSLISLKPSQVV